MSSQIVLMSDYGIGRNEDILSTHFLGSCVSVVLYDKKRKVGALSHSLLPSKPSSDYDEDLFRYVDQIIPFLIKEMLDKGSDLNSISAMIFGGSNMKTLENFNLEIGKKNVLKGKEILNSFRIPILFEDTGGEDPRSIELNCQSGEIIVKKACAKSIKQYSF